MTADRSPQRPIGFWLKLIDGLIDDRFEQILDDNDLTRRHWQLLNVLRDGPRSSTEVDDAVSPFLDENETTVRPILESLAEISWVSTTDGRWSLTPIGDQELEHLSTRMSEFRRSTADGITEDDYSTTLSVLEQMALNLGWTDS